MVVIKGYKIRLLPTIEQEVLIRKSIGVKSFAVCSNGAVYKNINKTHTVKQLNKKLRRLQRQVSRKYLKISLAISL